ncbi:MAG: hypothetical protein WD898_00375 [Candidatus Paceibacterota bacterium]
MYKRLALIIIVGIASIIFWSWVGPWVASPTKFAQESVWLKPLLSLGVLTALLGLAFMLLKNILWRIVASVITGLPFFVIFGFNKFYLLAFGSLILLHLYAMKNIRAEVEQRTEIDIRIIMRRGLGMVIMPILIMVSFAFFFSPNVQASAKDNQLPPTFKQVIRTVMAGFLGGELEELPPEEREQTETAIVEEVFNRFNDFLGPYFKYFPPILAFGLFLILQGLSIAFVWLGVGISALLFLVLKRSGLVRIELVRKDAEKLQF